LSGVIQTYGGGTNYFPVYMAGIPPSADNPINKGNNNDNKPKP